MSTLQDNDIFIYQNSDTNTTGTVANSNRSSLDPDKDHFLVQRTDNGTTTTYRVAAGDVGGGSDSPAVITTEVTLTASSSFFPSTLTATKAVVTNGTEVTSYQNWYKNDVAIGGATGLTYEATEAGTYKYKEEWVGNDSVKVYSEAEVTVSATPAIATPSIITPAKGAGQGLNYYPSTSGVTNLTQELDPPGATYSWSTDVFDGNYVYGYARGEYIEVVILYQGEFAWREKDTGNWQTGTMPAFTTSYKSVHYSNGTFFAGFDKPGSNPLVYATENGTNAPSWATTGTQGDIYYFTNNDDWIVGAPNPSKNQAWYFKSRASGVPGVSWGSADVPSGKGLYPTNIRYVNGRVAVVGDNGSGEKKLLIQSGVDPTGTPHEVTMTTDYKPQDIAYCAPNADNPTGAYVLLDDGGCVYRSTEDPPITPSNWTKLYRFPYSSQDCKTIISDNGNLFGTGYNGPVVSKDQGQTWFKDTLYTGDACDTGLIEDETGGYSMYNMGNGGHNPVVRHLDETTVIPPSKVNVYTFRDNNVYSQYQANYNEVPTGETLSQVFKVGDKTKSAGKDTGTVYEVGTKTMKLIDPNYNVDPSSTLYPILLNSQVPLDGPTLTDGKFTASTPTASSGSIGYSNWGNAKWEISETNFDSPTNVKTQTKAISPNTNQQINASQFSGLVTDKEYFVRVTYDAEVTDTAAGSTIDIESSPSAKDHNFKFEKPKGWNKSTIGQGSWEGLAYGGGKFVAASTYFNAPVGVRIRYAEETETGLVWQDVNHENISVSTSTSFFSVAYGGDRFVAVCDYAQDGTGTIVYSDDGVNWLTSNMTRTDSWKATAYGIVGGQGRFISVADTNSSNAAMSSSDGNVWYNDVSMPTGADTRRWWGIAYSPTLNRWVALDRNGRFAYSDNGTSFTNCSMYDYDGNMWWMDIMWSTTFNKFIACGGGLSSDVRVQSSDDGVNWYQNIETVGDKAWQAIGELGGTVVCGGSSDGEVITLTADDPNKFKGPYRIPGMYDVMAFASSPNMIVATGRNAAGYSYTGTARSVEALFYDTENFTGTDDIEVARKYGINPTGMDDMSEIGLAPLTEQPDYPVAGYELQPNGEYKPLEDKQPEVDRLEALMISVATEWQYGATYNTGDIVKFNCTLWRAKKDAVTTQTPTTRNVDCWENLQIECESNHHTDLIPDDWTEEQRRAALQELLDEMQNDNTEQGY